MISIVTGAVEILAFAERTSNETSWQHFSKLMSNVGVAVAACFTVVLILLLIDAIIQLLFRTRLADASIHRKLGQCVRIAFFSTAVLVPSLIVAAARRSFTDASSFDIPQMWWHSLCSIINITSTCLINLAAGGNLRTLGFPTSFKPHGRRWLVRFFVVLAIVFGTHTVTPLLYGGFRCFGEFWCIDYSNKTKLQVFYFFFVQQVCFFINGVDEETAWRGFINSLYCDIHADEDTANHAMFQSKPKTAQFSPWVMYIVSGMLYGLCHLNNASSSFESYMVVIFNMICEGSLWMYLYRSSGDLVMNWILHDVDDLFSIWIGLSSLAGYSLPMGQICPFSIGCHDDWVSGGTFGQGGSFLYIAQNMWTLLVIFICNRTVFDRPENIDDEAKPINTPRQRKPTAETHLLQI